MRKKKLKATVDIEKNRLLLTFSDRINKKELDSFYTDLRFCVADLQANFDVIADYSHCKLARLNTIPTVRKITTFLVANKVRTIVRIMPQSSFFIRQMLNIGAQLQGYKPIYVSNMEEAENKLKKASPRQYIRFLLNQHPIDYTTGDTSVSAIINDLSVGGCGVITSEPPPVPGTDISVTFSLKNKEYEDETFTFKAKIIWSKEQQFGAMFTTIEEEQQTHLLPLIIQTSHAELAST